MTLLDRVASVFDLNALDQEGCNLAIIDGDSRILWVNRAWTQFATENANGQTAARCGVGANYLDAVSEPLRSHYEEAFRAVRRTHTPYVQRYFCHSPTQFREYRFRAIPALEDALLCEHSLIQTGAHREHGPPDLDPSHYMDEHGLFSQCSNCRRVRGADRSWHWVPEWVAQAPGATSHCICSACGSFHYSRWLGRSRIPAP
jgi:hypothetical protein